MDDDLKRALAAPCPGCKVEAGRGCVDPETGTPVETGVHSGRLYRALIVAEADAHNRAVELAAEVERLKAQLAAADWLVWSNQRGMWWRAGWSGYTALIEEAGHYTLAAAEEIVRTATVDGALKRERINPVTGHRYTSFDEVLVAAPKPAETEEIPF